MMSNNKRAEYGQAAIAFGTPDGRENDAQTNLIDVLANLRHWADAVGAGFDAALAISAEHHRAEVAEARRAFAPDRRNVLYPIHQPEPPMRDSHVEELQLGAVPAALADAWRRYSDGGDVSPAELRALDDWRATRAEDLGL